MWPTRSISVALNRENCPLIAYQHSPEASLTSDISPQGGAWLHQTRLETCISASDRPRVAIVVWRSDSYGYFLLLESPAILDVQIHCQ